MQIPNSTTMHSSLLSQQRQQKCESSAVTPQCSRHNVLYLQHARTYTHINLNTNKYNGIKGMYSMYFTISKARTVLWQQCQTTEGRQGPENSKPSPACQNEVGPDISKPSPACFQTTNMQYKNCKLSTMSSVQ